MSLKTCRICHQSIEFNEDYLHDCDELVHVNCYHCSACQQTLNGIFYYRYKDPRKNEKRKLLCEKCYHRYAPVCFACLKIIDEIYLMYGERIFHPNCFRCQHCQRSFQGKILFPYENQVYCADCYDIVQNQFHPTATTILMERCAICRRKFEPGDLITQHENNSTLTIDDDNREKIFYIHNSCFVCQICHGNLSNSIYYSPNNHDDDGRSLEFQCESCHQISASICSNCFKPSNDLMIIFNNRWYHDQCFQCKICHYRLKNLTRIITESDGFLCERCLKSIRDREQSI